LRSRNIIDHHFGVENLNDIKLTGDVLRQSARRLADKTAIICGSVSMTYAELDRQADLFSNALVDLNFTPDTKIAIMARNIPAYPVIHFGAARSGCVLVHASTRYITDELAYVLEKSEARSLIVDARFLEIAVDALKRASDVRQLIVIDHEGLAPALPDNALDFDNLLASASGKAVDVEISENDPFAITFTGGTTGFPKGVLVSHKARLISSRVGASEQNIVEDDIAAITTPLFHTAGLYVWYQPAVMMGATCVLVPDWSPQNFLAAVSANNINAAFLVPTQIIMLLNAEGYDDDIFRRISKIAYGGAPMPPALLDELLERFPGLELANNYGQTEACPLAMFRADKHPDRVATLGRAPRGIEVAVLDDDGNAVPPGEVGEIASRGDHSMIEYFNEPDQTDAYFRGDRAGWGWTGDLGVMDDEGYISLVDRAKDMFISGGENIFPKEIENVLHQHPAVAECAVFGIPDEIWGEVGAAHVCLRKGIKASEQELIDFCIENLARFKRPRVMRLVEDLPRTAVGKIQKTVLRDLYRTDRQVGK